MVPSGDLLTLHVDDFIFCGLNEWLTNIVQQIKRTFEISSSAQGCFRHLGLNLVQAKNEIFVDQDDYTNELKGIDLDRSRKLQKNELLDKHEVKELRAVAGRLLWVSSNTRPDLAYDTCVVSNYGKAPTVSSCLLANKAVQKAKKTHLKLVFPDLGDPDLWKIRVYSDAAHASLSNQSSQAGYIVFVEGNGRLAPMLWSSKKITRVTKSPLAAETMALADAADAGNLLAASIKELFGRLTKMEIICVTDSKSLKEHLQTSNVIEDMRLRLDMARLQEMVDLGEIKIAWVKGKQQLADSLTKFGASAVQLLEVLGSGLQQ